MKKYSFLPLLLFPLFLIAQDPDRTLGSMRRDAMDEQSPDSIRSGYLFGLTSYYQERQPDSALYFAEELYRFAEAKEDDQALADALLHLGFYHIRKGMQEEALSYWLRSEELYTSLEDPVGAANVLNNIGLIYGFQGEMDLQLAYIKRSLEKFQSVGAYEGIGNTELNIGTIYVDKGEYKLAKEYYERALKSYEKGKLPRGIASVSNKRGELARLEGNYPQALDHLFESLKLYEELEDLSGVAASSGTLGIVFGSLGENDQALIHLLRAIRINEQIGDQVSLANELSNIGAIYRDREMFDSALYYTQQCLSMYEAFGDPEGIASSYHKMGNLHRDQREFEQGIQYFKQSIEISESIQDLESLALTQVCLGYIYCEQGEYEKAISLGEQAFKYSRELDNLTNTGEATHLLHEAYEGVQNYQKAVEMYGLCRKISDSLSSDENQRALYRFEYQRKNLRDSLAFVQKQAETELSYQKELAQRNYWLFGGLGLALIAGMGFYFWQQRRLKEKELTHQREMLSSTILTQEQERQRIAKDLHDSVGSKLGVMNLFLHQLNRKSPEAETDVRDMLGVVGETIQTTRRISHDLLPPTLETFGLATAIQELGDQVSQTQGPGMKIEIEGERPEGVAPLVELNLFRILQELLNNSLKYAQANQISLRLIQSADKIILQYHDDGIGFDPQRLENQKGLGMQNIQSRLQMIEGKMDLQSAPGQGVQVQVEVDI